MNTEQKEWLQGIRQPSQEYKAALDEMLAMARLVHQAAFDLMGKVSNAIEAQGDNIQPEDPIVFHECYFLRQALDEDDKSDQVGSNVP